MPVLQDARAALTWPTNVVSQKLCQLSLITAPLSTNIFSQAKPTYKTPLQLLNEVCVLFREKKYSASFLSKWAT